MPHSNKAILEKANAAIAAGDIEGFLSFCADDIEWTSVGDKTLKGKEAVRGWMLEEYAQPPKFSVTQLIADGDAVVVLGIIDVRDEGKRAAQHLYCDVWRFREGLMVELKAFVIGSGRQEA